MTEACLRSEPLAQSKAIQFERVIPDKSILVSADAHSLQRLFLILTDNAIKYTPASGHVRVSMDTESDDAVVRIQDAGIGISKEDLPFIFDRFYRADKVRSREAGGAGLGLSIARWIAEAHHASVSANSTLGEGSTFEVRIPRVASGS